MFAKGKYLLAIGLLFLIPACVTAQATGTSVDIYVEAAYLLGPSGNGSGYTPQIYVWPSISFLKKN